VARAKPEPGEGFIHAERGFCLSPSPSIADATGSSLSR
jgi:hypothetical protein